MLNTHVLHNIQFVSYHINFLKPYKLHYKMNISNWRKKTYLISFSDDKDILLGEMKLERNDWKNSEFVKSCKEVELAMVWVASGSVDIFCICLLLFFIFQLWFSGFVEYCEEVVVVVFIFPYWCWIFWGGGTGGRGGWWVTVMTQQITLMIQPPLIVQLKPPLFQIFHFLISHSYFFSYFLSTF